MDLMLVIPSRGRPGEAAAFVDAVRDTTQPGVFCVIALDADDPTAADYESAMRGRGNAIVHVAGDESAVVVAHRLAPGAVVLVLSGDDRLPLRLGWDRELLRAVAGFGGGIVHAELAGVGVR